MPNPPSPWPPASISVVKAAHTVCVDLLTDPMFLLEDSVSEESWEIPHFADIHGICCADS